MASAARRNCAWRSSIWRSCAAISWRVGRFKVKPVLIEHQSRVRIVSHPEAPAQTGKPRLGDFLHTGGFELWTRRYVFDPNDFALQDEQKVSCGAGRALG